MNSGSLNERLPYSDSRTACTLQGLISAQEQGQLLPKKDRRAALSYPPPPLGPSRHPGRVSHCTRHHRPVAGRTDYGTGGCKNWPPRKDMKME